MPTPSDGDDVGPAGAAAAPPSPSPLALAARPLTPLAAADADGGAAEGPASPSLSILTWNVLADGLAQHGAFVRCPPPALEWAPRRAAILAELTGEAGEGAADVIALQEVNRCDDLAAPLAAAGYDGRLWTKPSSPATALGAPPDGCALFWRRDRFALLAVEGRPFDAQSAGQAAAARDPAASSSSDGPVAVTAGGRGVQGMLVVTLADTHDRGRPVAVACVHLTAKGYAALRAAQAAEAAAAVLAAAQAAATTATPAPIAVLAGDLNDGPASAAAAAVEAAGMTSVWAVPPAGDDGGGAAPLPAPDTTFKFRAGDGGSATVARRCSDYVFFSTATAAPVAARRPPADLAAAAPQGLPCAQYPSDHVAVVGVVRGV